MNSGMSIDMYDFIIKNRDKIKIDTKKGIVTTPKNTNGTLCSSTGYLRVKINKKLLQVHQILAVSYFGNECIGMQINHKNGNKTDNSKENLEVCTREENVKHAWETNLCKNAGSNSLKGVLNPSSKLSKEDVLYIRDSKDKNFNLSIKFNVSERTIGKVKNKESYKNI